MGLKISDLLLHSFVVGEKVIVSSIVVIIITREKRDILLYNFIARSSFYRRA